jgi:hypothetical protein
MVASISDMQLYIQDKRKSIQGISKVERKEAAMPRVFVAAKEAFNASKASKFGEITILHDPSESAQAKRFGLAPDRIFMKFARPMNSFEANDILLLDGPNVYCAMAAAMAAVTTSRLTLLIYDHHIGGYVKRTIHLPVRQCRKDTDGNPQVFAATDSHDLKAARRFGAIEVLVSVYKDVFATETRRILKMILGPLKTSLECDFLLLSGEKSINALAAAVMARRHKKLNMLLMNHKSGRYLPRTVEVSRERIRSVIS